jgi:hypothetical protein
VSGHTPGPWRVEPYRGVREDGRVVVEVFGNASAPVASFLVLADGEVSTANGKEDANLIAAAPELLAACRTILDWLPSHAQRERAQVREAIAKAEGRQ